MTLPIGSDLLFDARVTGSILAPGGGAISDGGLVGTWSTSTQTTAANQPTYDSISLGGGPCLLFGGAGSPAVNTPTWMNIPSTSIGLPFTLAAMFRADGFPPNTLAGFICDLSAGGVSSGNGTSLDSGASWSARIHGAGGLQNVDAGTGEFWACMNNSQYVVLTHDGTTAALYINGQLIASAPSGSAPGVGAFSVPGIIGASNGGANPLTGEIGLLVRWPRVLSVADMTMLDSDIRSSWRLTNSQLQKYNTIVVGDSTSIPVYTWGNTATTPPSPNSLYSTAYCIANDLGGRFGKPYNNGISGAVLSSTVGGGTFSILTSGWSGGGGFGQGGVQALQAGVPNVVFVEGGTNDIGINNLTGPQTATAMHNLVTQIVSDATGVSSGGAFHLVLVSTILYAAGRTSPQETARQNANATILANASSWGNSAVHVAAYDPGGDVLLGSATGNPSTAPSTYFRDGLHPSKKGKRRASTFAATALIAAGL